MNTEYLGARQSINMLSILPLVLLLQSPTVDFVSTVEFLEKRGFPNPTSGTYCQATYTYGSIWGFKGQGSGPGWAMPLRKNEPQRFITTGGVVQDLIKVEKKRDLKADLAATFAKPWSTNRDSILLLRNGTGGVPLAPEIQPSEDFLVMAYLAGEKKGALAAFEKRGSQGNEPVFVSILRPMMSAMLDRSISAHQWGKDRFAADSLKWIVDNRAALEDAGKKSYRGDWERQVQSMGEYARPAVFDFLKIAPTLYADSIRRVKEARKPVDLKALSRYPVDRQVKVLIDELENVSARQMSQPGSVMLNTDPIVKALVEIGGPSVDPLVECIEKDTRLTRSVGFARDFFPARNLIPVSRAARAAYDQIVQVFNLPPGSTPSDLRAYWEKTKHLTPAERQFEVLRDDSAVNRWSDAARYLMTPTTWTQIGLGGSIQPPAKPGEKLTLRAEALRTRTNPSLTELLTKRAMRLAINGGGFDLIQMLDQWEPKAVTTSGHQVFDVFAKSIKNDANSFDSAALARFVRTMVRRGDKEILSRYAAWLSSVTHFDPGYEKALWFYPVVEHMDEPAFSGLVRKMFNPIDGKINLVKMQEQMPGWNHVEGFLASPVLRHPEFRAVAIDILRNRKVIGETSIENQTVRTKSGSSTSTIDTTNAKDLAQYEGKKTTYRLNDALAFSLTREDAAPIRPYWSEAERDKAIEALIISLEKGTYEAPKTWHGDYGPDWL